MVTGQPYQGTWYVPGGGSYTAALIKDAGGTYPWASEPSTGSISTDVETVFAKSGDGTGLAGQHHLDDHGEALAENAVFAKFTAFKTGNVWNAAKDVTPSGGNNFYELGAVRPDLTLADLVAILHPEKLPDHAFAFYLSSAERGPDSRQARGDRDGDVRAVDDAERVRRRRPAPPSRSPSGAAVGDRAGRAWSFWCSPRRSSAPAWDRFLCRSRRRCGR